MADVATLQTELTELRALKLKLIRSGGVEEYSSGGKRIRRYTLKEINDAIRELECELNALGGGTFQLIAPIQ